MIFSWTHSMCWVKTKLLLKFLLQWLHWYFLIICWFASGPLWTLFMCRFNIPTCLKDFSQTWHLYSCAWWEFSTCLFKDTWFLKIFLQRSHSSFWGWMWMVFSCRFLPVEDWNQGITASTLLCSGSETELFDFLKSRKKHYQKQRNAQKWPMSPRIFQKSAK